MGKEDYLLTSTSSANIYLYEDGNKKKIYKKFYTPLSIIDKGRYDSLMSIKSDLVILPEELVLENGFISGYTSDYVDGVTLEESADKISLADLIHGIKDLGIEYDKLADMGVTVSDVNLMNLVYSNGKIYNIDTDSFKVSNNPNKIVFKLRNSIALKQACFTMLANSLTFTSDMRDTLDRDMKKYSVTAAEMLYNFILLMEMKYNKKFDTISKIRNEIIGDEENTKRYR